MNVLLLDLGPTLRGGQRQVYYLARRLARESGMKAVTACPWGSPLAVLLQDEGLPVFTLPGRAVWNPLLFPLLLTALGRARHPVLHTHDAHAAALGWALKCLRPDVSLVHTRRVSYPLSGGFRLRKYLAADAVVGVSAEITAQLNRAGVPPSKTRTIHSGIDPCRYAPRLKEKTGCFRFLSVGALTPQKGYATLVEAAALLAGEVGLPDWEVRVVGDGPLRSALTDQARRLGVQERVHWAGWRDSCAELPLADAVVVPSTDGEGSSAVVKEGWATGLPVVCTSLPSNTELIRDEENGLLVPPGDAAALASIMRRCLLDPESISELAQRGMETLSSFTDTHMAEAYLALYEELDAARKG